MYKVIYQLIHAITYFVLGVLCAWVYDHRPPRNG